MSATEAQVAAAETTLQCARVAGGRRTICWEHSLSDWSDRGCPVAVSVAVSVADAVVAAGPDPANALRQYADDLADNESADEWGKAEFVADARQYADDYPKWLS